MNEEYSSYCNKCGKGSNKLSNLCLVHGCGGKMVSDPMPLLVMMTRIANAVERMADIELQILKIQEKFLENSGKAVENQENLVEYARRTARAAEGLPIE